MNDTIQSVFAGARDALEAFDNFDAIDAAVKILGARNGVTIISGIGKSGLIGQKLASTMRSFGRNAFFIHAAEASHGDLGCFDQAAVAIVFSNSGETTELSDVVKFCQTQSIPIIAITAKADSTIASAATATIAYGNIREADGHDLAPTTSTTVMGVIGDALAITDADKRGFQAEEFAQLHPRGRLGARLKRARDLMHSGDALPILPMDVDMAMLAVMMSQKALGLAILMDGERVAGVITDGDLRRNIDGLFTQSPIDIATRNPKSVPLETPIPQAIKIMGDALVTQLLVTDNDGGLRGVLHLHDCTRL